MEGTDLESSSYCSGSAISNLLKELSIMSKKVSLDSDLTKILDEFLVKLHTTDKSLANGIVSTNFVEAALLLQTSGDIYSKKVDLLWDVIIQHQKRMAQYMQTDEESAKEIEILEERKRKYTRKKKTNKDESVSKLVNEFSFNPNENYDALNHDYESADLLGSWANYYRDSTQKSQSLRVFVDKNSEFSPLNEIHSCENEYMGRYNQFVSSSLLEEILSLEDNHLLKNEDKCVSRMRIDSYLISDFLWSRSIPCDAPLNTYIDDLKGYIANHVQNFGVDIEKNGYEACINRKRCYVQVERLPRSLIQEKIRRISRADSMFDDTASLFSHDLFSDDDHQMTNRQLDCSLSLEKRSKSCSQDSAFYDEDDMERTIPSLTPSKSEKSIIDGGRLCCGSSAIIIPKMAKEKLYKRVVEVKKAPKVGSKKAKRFLLKLATGLTVNSQKFEKFYSQQYKSADGEGDPPHIESESEESDDDDDFAPPEMSQQIDEDVPDRCATEVAEDCLEDLSTPTPNLSRFDLERQEASYRSVREWKQFITPKLKEAAGRTEFNIHEYSAHIVNGADVGETFRFKDLVAKKTPADVARFFLATLTLATTGNVELSGVQHGALSNDTFQVKVVDKTRHHELLEEYHAPSEETFRQKLLNAKVLNPQLDFHSTPIGLSAAKRAKFGFESKSRKNLFG